MAYTEEVIAFAAVNEGLLLDAIPLSEIISIDLMKDLDQSDEHHHHLHNSYEAAIDFSRAFQIRTHKDGQNAGRKYVLRADTDDQATTFVSELNHLSKVAAERAVARTRWGSIKQRVRNVYDSSVFQGMSAILIVAVRFFMCQKDVRRAQFDTTIFRRTFFHLPSRRK